MTRFLPIVLISGILVLNCDQNHDRQPAGEASCLKSFLQSNPEGTQDIIVITIDTWRHDAAGFNGGQKVNTPAMDQLAKQGVVFNNAFAQASLTLPSHASIFTGLYPYRHGLRDNAGFRLDENIPTLAAELKKNGYATAAFLSAFPLDARYGLNSGFDVYDDFFDRYEDASVKVIERPAHATLANARAWLEKNRQNKKFMWIHLYEPHFPYAPPEPFSEQYAKRPYYGEVAYLDQVLGDFLSEISRSDRPTTLVLTSDHGESLGEHGELTHGVFAYDATIKVPLVFWSPDLLKPGQVETPVQLVDIVPTLLHLHGMKHHLKVDGSSLLDDLPQKRQFYFESLGTHINRGWAPLRGCIVNGTKAIDLPKPELYDLKNDPGEIQNLARQQTTMFEQCLSCLPEDLGLGARETLSAEEIDKLSALGYLAASEVVDRKGEDPKDLIHLDRMIHHAFTLSGEGRYQEAIEAMHQVIDRDAGIEIAYQHLSDFHHHMGQIEPAISVLEKALEAGIHSEITHRKLALLYLAIGEIDKAFGLLDPWVNSQDPDTLAALAKAYGRRGKFEKAQHFFEQALAIDQSSSKIEADFGTMYLYAKRPEKAQIHFQKSLDQNERNAAAWNGSGVVFSQQGNQDAAIHAWEKALSCDPKLAFCHFNLSVLYEQNGQLEKARNHLRAYADTVNGPEKQKALKRLETLVP